MADLCMHRQVRGHGRQDLFCKRTAGHDGNHYHDAHPQGARWVDGAWHYGYVSTDEDAREEAYDEAHAAAFATFGPEVPAAVVPAMVRLGAEVWSYTYGHDDSDPESFTVLTVDDLDVFATADELAEAWGPFRLTVGTDGLPVYQPDAVLADLGLQS